MQYEYQIIRQELGAMTSRLLNEHGDDGWELCATETVDDGGFEVTRFIMKRRKFGEHVEPRHNPVQPVRPGPEAKMYDDPRFIEQFIPVGGSMSQHDREAYAEATNR